VVPPPLLAADPLQRAAARLEIVGASPQPHIQELARDKAVTVTGYVPDLRQAYARSHVAIAPS